MSDIHFIDTTLRDGQQSLWALGMKTDAMLGATISDEELLLRVYAGPDAVDALMTNGAPKPKLDAKQPLLNLIEELTKKKDCHHIYIRRDGVSLKLGRAKENSPAAVSKST